MAFVKQYSVLLSWKIWSIPCFLSFTLLIISHYNFLLFHTLAELLTVIVGILMFVIASYTNTFSHQRLLTYLAAGYFWVAGMDLIHTLTYKGMGIFHTNVAEHATQFWISSRYMEAILLFSAPLVITYCHPKIRWAFIAFGVIAISVLLSIMSHYFPSTYVEGVGLTDFKIVSEYIICLILLAALFNFYKYQEVLPDGLFPFISLSIIFTILAELAFTSYISVYGPANIVGHILKLLSFWLIFYSVIRSSLHQPYKKIALSEKRFKNIVESMSDLVWEVDIKGRYTYCSAKMASVLGYRSNELIGKTFFDFMSNQESARVSAIFSKASAEKVKIQNLDIIKLHKNGHEIFLLKSGSPILNHDGKLLGYQGVDTDLTSQKALEDQFQQAQKMEALGTLVGGIAHDFNNMLAGMTGNLYLAKKKSTDTDVINKLTSVEELSFRASEMIQQLLLFARKGNIAMKRFNLTTFVKEIIKMVQVTVPENISFKINTCQEDLFIEGNATQIQQVLMNLIKNAKDALENMGDPYISLTIESFKADASFKEKYPNIQTASFAKITVEDNGKGISQDALKHIFEPFFTTKKIGVGTGLGLAMSYGVIKDHNGFIDVKSYPDQGTSFDVYLPLHHDATQNTESETIQSPTRGNGETILLVDDDSGVRISNKDILESLNYKILEASNGLEAVNLVTDNAHNISLIIMDVVMPKLGGVAAMQEINKIRPDIKVIFCTGYDKTEGLTELSSSEVSSVISKPYDVTSFSDIIRRKLDS